MNLLTTLEKILDFADPSEHADDIRAMLVKIKKGLRKSVDDEELRDYVNEYLDAWLEADAIEDDPDAFKEETQDLLEELEEDEDEDEDFEDDDD